MKGTEREKPRALAHRLTLREWGEVRNKGAITQHSTEKFDTSKQREDVHSAHAMKGEAKATNGRKRKSRGSAWA